MIFLIKLLKKQGFLIAAFFCLSVLVLGGSQNLAQVKTNNPKTMSWEVLRNSYKEMVGCRLDDPCTKTTFTSKQLANWLVNCKYRDPDRIGKPNFNAIDFAFLDLSFPHCFADRLKIFNVWAYKGTSMTDEEGVAYNLIPKMSDPLNPYRERVHNMRADYINSRNPLEVPVARVADVIFQNIAVHGYKNQKGEKVADVREWRDYFAPRVGLTVPSQKDLEKRFFDQLARDAENYKFDPKK